MKSRHSIASSGLPPLVIVDEVQKIPLLMDMVQYLIDEKIAQFILTGSSARKLKKPGHINLLPGRVVLCYFDPLSLNEISPEHSTIERLVISGTLPEIYLTDDTRLKEQLLQTYVTTYLEEEVRAESLVRNLGAFAKFLTLAALESGNTLNLSHISQEIGIAHTTIAEYYQILEDCLIAHRIEPITKMCRKKLMKSPKYLFFDLGVERVCAGYTTHYNPREMGQAFERLIGLALLRHIHITQSHYQLQFWRTYNGQEVDWVLTAPHKLIPIEVKFAKQPTLSDAKHLKAFMALYPEASRGYIISNTPFVYELDEAITVLPWKDVLNVFPE